MIEHTVESEFGHEGHKGIDVPLFKHGLKRFGL